MGWLDDMFGIDPNVQIDAGQGAMSGVVPQTPTPPPDPPPSMDLPQQGPMPPRDPRLPPVQPGPGPQEPNAQPQMVDPWAGLRTVGPPPGGAAMPVAQDGPPGGPPVQPPDAGAPGPQPGLPPSAQPTGSPPGMRPPGMVPPYQPGQGMQQQQPRGGKSGILSLIMKDPEMAREWRARLAGALLARPDNNGKAANFIAGIGGANQGVNRNQDIGVNQQNQAGSMALRQMQAQQLADYRNRIAGAREQDSQTRTTALTQPRPAAPMSPEKAEQARLGYEKTVEGILSKKYNDPMNPMLGPDGKPMKPTDIAAAREAEKTQRMQQYDQRVGGQKPGVGGQTGGQLKGQTVTAPKDGEGSMAQPHAIAGPQDAAKVPMGHYFKDPEGNVYQRDRQ